MKGLVYKGKTRERERQRQRETKTQRDTDTETDRTNLTSKYVDMFMAAPLEFNVDWQSFIYNLQSVSPHIPGNSQY